MSHFNQNPLYQKTLKKGDIFGDFQTLWCQKFQNSLPSAIIMYQVK